MHLFMLSVIIIVVALMALKHFHANPHHDNVLSLPTRPNANKPVPFGTETVVEKENDSVKVIVTYLDGTKETFINRDGEVRETGGVVTIRPDNDHCITIGAYSYKKIEEIHE